LDPEQVVLRLYREGTSPPAIAEMIGVKSGARVIREMLRSLGAYRPFRFEERVKELGYDSIRAFFLANARKTYVSMAKELGCTWLAVQKRYEREFELDRKGGQNDVGKR
jgi:hypothetical protein